MVGNYGLHVTATDTISLYTCMASTISSSEMTCVLPTPSLGTQYMVQCYPAKASSNTMFRSQFCVVATADNTNIAVRLTGSTLDGLSPNTTYHYTLNAGQVIRFRGTSTGGDSDLTGSTIDADKNVAVFSGHFCAYVPHTSGASCDHVYDQHPPITAWGTRFVARTTGAVVSDHVRIMPRFNNTAIYINGNYAATTNAGQIYDFTLSTSNPTAYIETCGPSLVYLFMGSTGNDNGDPSMMPILPVEQMAQDITFCTYHTQGCNIHFVNIIAETSEVPSLRLDNNSISSQFQPCSANSFYSTAQIQLSEGSHR
ncbi:MAG: IgGFc-binding protein, partial [Bacteroidales bacterium]|nr:IgGFc-binding protein [Bacteroidales bacterium]